MLCLLQALKAVKNGKDFHGSIFAAILIPNASASSSRGFGAFSLALCIKTTGTIQGPPSFAAKGTTNIERHLHDAHRMFGPSGKRLPKGLIFKKHSTEQFFKLDANDGKEQAFINTLKDHFDKNVFQSHRLAWITESNVAFRAIDAPRFRYLLDYLDPSVTPSRLGLRNN